MGYIVNPFDERDLQKGIDVAFQRHRIEKQSVEKQNMEKQGMEKDPGKKGKDPEKNSGSVNLLKNPKAQG